jgi:hypothetical protein
LAPATSCPIDKMLGSMASLDTISLEKHVPKFGCKMRDRTKGGGYTDPNGEFQGNVWSVGELVHLFKTNYCSVN